MLNKEYNQKRQAKITSEIIELVAGAFGAINFVLKEQEEREREKD